MAMSSLVLLNAGGGDAGGGGGEAADDDAKGFCRDVLAPEYRVLRSGGDDADADADAGEPDGLRCPNENEDDGRLNGSAINVRSWRSKLCIRSLSIKTKII